MRKRAIAALTIFVSMCTLYSIGMLYTQFQISSGLDKSLSRIGENSIFIKNVEFSRVSLSPFFFINKQFYIKDIIIQSKVQSLSLYVKSIHVSGFVKNEKEIFPTHFETDSMSFLSLNSLKESIKNINPKLSQSEETINFIFNSPAIYVKGELKNDIYEIDSFLSINHKKILDFSFSINDTSLIKNNNLPIFIIKNIKLDINNIPISIKNNLKTNKELQDLMGDRDPILLSDLKMSFSENTQKTYQLKLSFLIQRILNINITALFLVNDILFFDEIKMKNAFILLEDQNFLNHYFKRKSEKDHISIDEEKRIAYKQNNFMLIFLENTPLEKGIFELNKFIEYPKYFFITLNPNEPISFHDIKIKAKEKNFALLHYLNINFKAFKDKTYIENDSKEKHPR